MNRSIFQVITQEYKCNDGGSRFIKHKLFRLAAKRTVETIKKSGTGSKGYQHIHVWHSIPHTFPGAFSKKIHTHNKNRDCKSQLHPMVPQPMDMNARYHVKHQYCSK